MSVAEPRDLVGQVHRVRQRTLQIAGWTRKLARHVVESPEWSELPEDARHEWLELEDRSDDLFNALRRTT